MCVQMIPLFSGSSGNAVFFQFGETRFLVDAGVSCKRISDALVRIGQNPAELDGIFITHDHSDHVQGLDVFVRKYNIPIYATKKAWQGIHAFEKFPHDESLDHLIQPKRPFFCHQVEVISFPTPHDAADSVGYRFDYRGYSISIVTDLGEFTRDIWNEIKGSQAVFLEANYNHEMLWSGPYPWSLKKRVSGVKGHLCNTDCARAISQLIEEGSRYFVLGHLSQENNAPHIALKEVEEYLTDCSRVRDVDYYLQVARRSDISEPVVLSGQMKPAAGTQMELFSFFEMEAIPQPIADPKD